MTSHVGAPELAVLLLVAAAFSAFGGVAVGAPEVAFRLRNLFMIDTVELSWFGHLSMVLGGGVGIGAGSLIAGVFLGELVGIGVGIAAFLAVLGVGAASAYYARERWGG